MQKIKKLVTGGLLVFAGAVIVPGMAMAAINATNHGDDVSSQSGDANSSNTNVSQTGQNGLINVQNGDNHSHTSQDASAITGDANSGQVVGQVGGDGSDPSNGTVDPSNGGGSTINA